MSRKRVEDPGANKSRSELAHTEARTEMTSAMQNLFQTFDLDQSGSISLDEFVKAQEYATELYGVPGGEKQALVEQYLEARAPGQMQLYGGGLSFEAFVRWQLQWQAPFWATGEEAEITERCRKLGEHIRSRRSTLRDSQRTPRHRPRRQNWPPQAPNGTRSCAHRGPRSARRYVCGGGMSTAAKGFVQPPPEVARDIKAYEDVQNLREESSDDEEYRQRKLAQAALVQEEADELRFIAEADVKSNILAAKLQVARLETLEALVPSQREACRVKQKHTLEEMQKFVISLAERHVGEMVVRGRIVRGLHSSLQSTLELQDVVSKVNVTTTKSDSEGVFKLSTAVSPQKGGSDLLLVNRHSGAATFYRKVAGEGLRRCRLDLLPMHSWYFEAESGSTLFEDKQSGVRFRIPQLQKAGQPFAGKAKLSYAVVLPDFGSMGRPVIKLKRRDNARDIALAEASRVSAMACAAVPERHGRSLAGSQVPLILTSAVFARLCDADGEELDMHDRLEVFLPCHSLALKELTTAPSLWSFQEDLAEWCQTPHLICANERELPLPRQPEAETESSRAKSFAQTSRPDAGEGYRAQQEAVAAAELQRGHEAWIRHLRQEPQAHLENTCYCGYRAKEAIMIYFRKNRKDLRLAEPPKRLFAGVEPDETGYRQCFPYRTTDDIAASAERAAAHPEVVMSHHLTAAARLLDPSPEIAKDLGLSPGSLFTFQHYDQISSRVLPHLRHLAAFLVDGARAIHSVTGDELMQVATVAIKMAALEFLVNCWIFPRKTNSAPTTVHELWEALKVRGGDVATAFLSVALQQANRDALASIRKQLRHRNRRLWASYHELLPALCGKSLEQMDTQLSGRAKVQELQEMVLHRGSRCRSAQVRAALHELPQRLCAAEQKALEKRVALKEAQTAAVQVSKDWTNAVRRLKKAKLENDLTKQLSEQKVTRELATLVSAKKEEVARLAHEVQQAEEEAESEQTMQGPADRLAQDASGAITQSDDAEQAWQEVMSNVPAALWEYGYPKALTFSFEIPTLGQWHAVGMAEAAPHSDMEAAKSKEEMSVDFNFFSQLPTPVQPALRTSAMVLGIFDGHEAGVVAVEVCASSMGNSGTAFSQVEADGTFCMFVAAKATFELWFTVADTVSSPLRFGPFLARSCDEVTHLGTLRASYSTKPGEWRKPVAPAGAFIMLPRVEIGGTTHERCSCNAQAFLEGTETSTDELSKELSKGELSKELSRQEVSTET